MTSMKERVAALPIHAPSLKLDNAVENLHLDIAYNWIKEHHGTEPYYADVYALAKKLAIFTPRGAKDLTGRTFERLMKHGLISVERGEVNGYTVTCENEGLPRNGQLYSGDTIYNAFVHAVYKGAIREEPTDVRE